MASIITNPALRNILEDIWEDHTIRTMVLSDGYSPNRDTHEFVSDVDAFELTGINRLTIAGPPDVVEDDVADRAEATLDNLVFSGEDSGQDARWVVLYVQIGGDDTTPGDDWIVIILDGGSTQTDGGGITVDFSGSSGVALRASQQ